MTEFREAVRTSQGLRGIFDFVANVKSMDGPITSSRVVSAAVFSGIALRDEVKKWAASQVVSTIEAALDFVLGVQPSAQRNVVQAVFGRLDTDCDGYLYFRDVAAKVDVNSHPLAGQGGISTQRIVAEYLNTWMCKGKHISFNVRLPFPSHANWTPLLPETRSFSAACSPRVYDLTCKLQEFNNYHRVLAATIPDSDDEHALSALVMALWRVKV